MKELLYKDWMIVKSTKSFIFPLFFLFGGITANYADSPFIPMIPIMFVYYLIMNLNAYDFKYNATTFILSFPVEREDWVGSRYVLSLIALGLSMIALFIIRMPFWVSGATFANLPMDLTILVMSHSIAMIYIAITLFGYFKYGYMKMRVINFISLAITFAASTAATRIMGEFGGSLLVVVLFIVVSLTSLWASYQMSVRSTRENIVL